MSRFRVLAVCLGVAMALSAAGAGVANAARPVQPQFARNGVTISTQFTIEIHSHVTRLWQPSLGQVFRCAFDEGQATIDPRGLDEGEQHLYGCVEFFIVDNTTTKQLEEGEEASKCTIHNGQIQIFFRSHLVWRKGVDIPADLLLPQSGKLAEFEIEGATCTSAGKYEVTGSVLAQIGRFGQDGGFGAFIFDTNNSNNEIKQLANEWEVEEKGVKETGTAEPKVGTSPEILEGVEQWELERQNNRRGLLGIR